MLARLLAAVRDAASAGQGGPPGGEGAQDIDGPSMTSH